MMWILIFAVYFAALAFSPPEYTFFLMFIPALIAILIYMSTCTWHENLFLAIAIPFLAVMLLVL